MASEAGDIGDLDRAAAAALASVTSSAASQLAALVALRTLAAALPVDGVARGLVETTIQDRQSAFVAFHERRLHDTPTDDAWAEALAFTIGVDGEGDAAAALRQRQREGAPVTSGPPQPFFARFLERQRR